MEKQGWLKRVFRSASFKRYEVEGHRYTFHIRASKGDGLEVWYENERVRSWIEESPVSHLVDKAFLDYKRISGLRYKQVLITDDATTRDNWYYKKGKTWVLTMREVLDMFLGVVALQGDDATDLLVYMRKRENELERG